jgi:hypothetical protein
MDRASAVVNKDGKPIAKFIRRKGIYLCKMTLKAPPKPIADKATRFHWQE